MKNVSIRCANAWLMGIDPAATGRQLKKLRRAHHLTQEELSELFERGGDSASRVIISMWENGRKLPTLSHVVFLAELYGCALDELVVSYRRSREGGDRDQPVPLIVHNCLAGEHPHMRMLAFFVGPQGMAHCAANAKESVNCACAGRAWAARYEYGGDDAQNGLLQTCLQPKRALYIDCQNCPARETQAPVNRRLIAESERSWYNMGTGEKSTPVSHAKQKVFGQSEASKSTGRDDAMANESAPL